MSLILSLSVLLIFAKLINVIEISWFVAIMPLIISVVITIIIVIREVLE